jgi:hypothetical protein
MTTPFVYDSEESFLEMLRKFYKYLHELTEASKEMSDDIIELRTEVNNFEDEINAEIQRINDILVEYDIKIERIGSELRVYVNDQIANLRNYVDSEDALLNERIRQIEVGNIKVYDPTTGLYSPIQIVIDNLYDMGRSNALTATEYDALELSATAYDAYALTARDYDLNGKTLLV